MLRRSKHDTCVMRDPLLAEVFGFPAENQSPEAQRHRSNKLCPFNNRVPNCTKDKRNDPLGVCTMRAGGELAIICPVRFREGGLAITDAADFFFAPGTRWTSLGEIRLEDAGGLSAGNIDYVLVAYDEHGRITDFGAVEVQSVYVSGNIRNPFKVYMRDPSQAGEIDWSTLDHPPRPDYLSSSRKRLAPQLLFKGGILNSWGKKQAVAVHKSFWDTLPSFKAVPREDADIAWLIYDLESGEDGRLHLVRQDICYTEFQATMLRVTQATPGQVDDFVVDLQERLKQALDNGDSQTFLRLDV